MTTFLKTKFKISDDHINIVKFRLAANITEYHIKKLIFNESLLQNFQFKEEEKIRQIGP